VHDAKKGTKYKIHSCHRLEAGCSEVAGGDAVVGERLGANIALA